MPMSDEARRREYNRLYVSRRLAVDPEFKRRHYERIKKNTEDKRAEFKVLIAAFRAQGCIVCGELEECCLDAHHVDPSQKDGSIYDMARRGCARSKFEAELAKCVCLCSNCHRKVHAGKIILGRVVPSG